MSQHIPYYDILKAEIGNTNANLILGIFVANIYKFCMKIAKLEFTTYPNYNKLKRYISNCINIMENIEEEKRQKQNLPEKLDLPKTNTP